MYLQIYSPNNYYDYDFNGKKQQQQQKKKCYVLYNYSKGTSKRIDQEEEEMPVYAHLVVSSFVRTQISTKCHFCRTNGWTVEQKEKYIGLIKYIYPI